MNRDAFCNTKVGTPFPDSSGQGGAAVLLVPTCRDRFPPITENRIGLRHPDTSAIWQFTIPRAGEYAIWGLSIHKENQSSIFKLVLDEQARVTWRVYGQWDQWLWSPAGNMITGSSQLFTLTVGEHTLRARTKTPTSSVAKIVVTDDPSWWPVEGMRK